MTENQNLRAIVLEMLLLMESEQEYSHLVLRDVLTKYDYLSGQEKAFIKRLFEGCIERRIELDYRINQISKVKTNKMKPVIRNIIRMGEYQLLYMDGVPESAACNEAVKLAVKKGFHTLKGFVNGIMRNLVRENGNMALEDLSVKYSMPQWIVTLLTEQYGENVTETMLQDMEKIHPVTIRVDENLKSAEKESLLNQYREQGILVKQHPYLPYAYEINGAEGVTGLEGFYEGSVFVSDVSSMLVAEIAGIKDGYEILDMCAAPGGKSLHMLSKLKGTGHLTSRDASEYKVSLIEENAFRSPYSNISIEVQDATLEVSKDYGRMDLVLVDAPCSGLGVMGKKRDIKYHASLEGIESLADIQKQILDVGAKYVKKDGILLYSTCTVTRTENEDQVKWFLKNHPEFVAESFEELLPQELKNDASDKGYLQLLPGIHRTDGFFMAKFRKINA